MSYDTIIIGAGITGLCAAYHLKKAGKKILLLESSDRAGGAIQSLNAEEFLLERGPNSLRGSHEFLDLVDELHLHDELITGAPKAPAYVYLNQKLQPVPMSPAAFCKTNLLSTAAKLRLLREPFIKPRTEISEESLASFVQRRLGNEVLENFVAPFVSGIYAGDPAALSVQAAFPRLANLENAGSILQGAIKAARTAKANKNKPARSLRPYRLCSFKNGLDTLPRALAKFLGDDLQLGAQIISVKKNADEKFALQFAHENNVTTITANSLVVATPAFAAAKLLREIAPEICAELNNIRYTTLVTVPVAYRTEQIATPLDGFGFLVPRTQGIRTLGSIWNSTLFANRAPEGWALVNNFIGGETDPAAIHLSDDELINTVHADLQKILTITGTPKRLPITRWHSAIPQYNLGHAARILAIENALKNQRGLMLAGNYLHGVALGDCIKQGQEIAAALR